jgi:hypothetical protein
MLMLLAVLLMFSVSQRALAMQSAWQVNADMISLINPDGTIAAYIGEGQVEPVAQQILTPLSFNYLTPVPPGASVISTNTAIIHVSIPSMTPTLAPTERPTDRPIDVPDPTSTNTKTNTRVVVYTPRRIPPPVARFQLRRLLPPSLDLRRLPALSHSPPQDRRPALRRIRSPRPVRAHSLPPKPTHAQTPSLPAKPTHAQIRSPPPRPLHTQPHSLLAKRLPILRRLPPA